MPVQIAPLRAEHALANLRYGHYTVDEDNALLDWISKITGRGIPVWSRPHWKEFQAKHPRHTWQGWKQHYRRCLHGKLHANLNNHNSQDKDKSESPLNPKLGKRGRRQIEWTEAMDNDLLGFGEDLKRRGIYVTHSAHWIEYAKDVSEKALSDNTSFCS